MNTHPISNRRTLVTLALYATSALTAFGGAADEEAKIEFFEAKIRPLLASQCYSCHAADTKPSGGLRVDDRNGLLVGGNTGPAVVAGDPEKSLLLKRVRHDEVKKPMPKEGDRLTDVQISDLTRWIKDGAAWPRERIPASIGKTRADYETLKAKHWAWQPLTKPKAPVVANAAWPEGDVDRFVLAKLEEKKLPPVADADATTLIRRVTYDLTGLPPTPAEIAAFLKDNSKEGLARVVDRLLNTPAFGERWGRHWLDVARYGESTGPSRNIPYPHAWKFRDYVIDAVQKDVPFNRFIQEQIAGDLLPSKNNDERDRLLTATGFLALGVKDVNQRFKVRFIMDNVDEQIDAVTRSVLGLTVNCARCHDHKFDPIPVTDYYALAGIFTSTDDCAGVRNKMGGGGLDYYDPKMLVKLSSDVPEAPAAQVAKLQAEADAAKQAFEDVRGTPEGLAKGPDGRPKQRALRVKYEKAQGELMALTDPAARGYAVHGVRESTAIADTEVRIRGEAERLGPTVPRGFLTTFAVPGAPQIDPARSGRLELAQWLTSEHNPLTPRVIVNRVWKNLFGQGIVSTVDNFGVKGDLPSHPELLDYLAGEFVSNGWSVKQLAKTLILSHAYRLGTETPAAHREVDPANHLVWRHSPRRLDAEEVRDSMLAVSGLLVQRPQDGSASKTLKMIEMRDNGAEARGIHQAADKALYRSVYLPLLRGVTPKALEAFDPVTQSLVTGQREATTVPTQALYLLNSGFVREQSIASAERVLASKGLTKDTAIKQIYLVTLGRTPSEHEITRAKTFLAEYEASYQEAPSTPTLAAVEAERPEGTDAQAQAVIPIPVNPDDVDRTSAVIGDDLVQPKNAETAAWMSLAQALYASAEFLFVR